MANRRSIESVRLTTGGASPTKGARSRTVIPVPEEQMYGVMNPQLGAYLAKTASDQAPGASAALAAGNALALNLGSIREREAYAQMLARAQDLQVDAQRRDINADLQGDVSGNFIEAAKLGAADVQSVKTDEGGDSYIDYNPTQLKILNSLGVNERQGGIMSDVSTAVGNLVEKTGRSPSDAALGELFANPVTGKPMEMVNRVTPATELDALTTETPEERLYRESAVAQINATASGGAKSKWLYNENGTPMGLEWSGNDAVEILRMHDELRKLGIDPYTGRRIGASPPGQTPPKSGAVGGAAPGRKAANQNTRNPNVAVPRGNMMSYLDPGYDDLERKLEEKYGLPQGLMRRIRVFGERSNANQESKKGARTVYQFTPGTREHFIKRWKIDPWSSPQAAAESAAIHLSDSIKRRQDPVLEYNAGPRKRGAWGSKEARDYKARVDGPQALAAARPPVDRSSIWKQRFLKNPKVADVSKTAEGHLVVTLKSGRTMVFNRGRLVRE